CTHYVKEIQLLTHQENGWHFDATHTHPDQIRDFQLEDMVTKMFEVAPEVCDLKTTIILCMAMHSRDTCCNALQSVMGVFLHACNTPDKVVKVLACLGISISLSTIRYAIKSLSKRSYLNIKRLGRTLLTSYAFDNFDVLLKTLIATVDGCDNRGLLHTTSGTLLRLEHSVTLEDLKRSQFLWNRSKLNLKATDPKPFDPLPVEAIPVTKLNQVSLRATDISQSTVAGNIDTIQNMYSQAGVGKPTDRSENSGEPFVDLEEFVTIIHGNPSTYEHILSALQRQSVERTSYNRLSSVVFVMGLFHFKMATADTIWQLLVAPNSARTDETSVMKIADQLRPKESSLLVSGAKFCQQHELIQHVRAVLRLNAWRVEIRKRMKKSLEKWAELRPLLSEVQEIADCLTENYVEGEELDLYDFAHQLSQQRDIVWENTMRTHHYLLLYGELCYAMNEGDIGRFKTLLPSWIPMFLACGKHKYSTKTLLFMHTVHFIYPKGLKRAIRYNILVNPSGKPHSFRAVDWMVELLNLYIKAIYGGEELNYTKELILLESVLILLYRSNHGNMEWNLKIAVALL
ncbi:hypothetical protein C8Q80DRAFT_1107242, partial [Daedaleopsis nitida]